MLHPDTIILTVEPQHQGLRLDKFLASHIPSLSRAKIQAAIRSGCATISGKPAKPSDLLHQGTIIHWINPQPSLTPAVQPQNIPLDILFIDNHLIVLNKPAGLVVHPGAGNLHGTLVSALLHHFKNLGGPPSRPGIVHRLDRETSGCLVVARTDPAHAHLSAQFASRKIQKTYLAIVSGIPRPPSGQINSPIRRHPLHRKKMAIAPPGQGRPSLTKYRLLTSTQLLSLLECQPLTGRTHQIRVHLKSIGHPIAGDPLYGNRGPFHRHLLHAWKLTLSHPATGQSLTFTAQPPQDFFLQTDLHLP